MIKRFSRILGLFMAITALMIAPAVQAQENLTCDSTARSLEGEEGDSFEVSCPANCGGGVIWGTNVYTDDSSVCAAAIHAGVLSDNGGNVTVNILAGQEEYPASEQNGVSSSSWGSWNTSFSFEGVETSLQLSCFDTRIDGATAGDSFAATCPAGCDAATVWGTNVYTNDSNICTAAAHAGAISLEDGGEFTLVYLAGQEEYPASEQNGIDSSEWGAWDISFAFAEPVECGTTSIEGAEIGDSYLLECQAGCSAGTVWGTDVYTEDSDICTAAAHAGIIDLEEGGVFILNITEGQEEYPASEQNDIESSDWGSWDASYSFSSIGAINLTCDAAAYSLVGESGDEFTVTCPSDCSAGSLWGTDVYTSDSSICTAAAHAGVIDLAEGGTFTVTLLEGQSSYEGTEQNGISSSTWGDYGSSFAPSN